jgi:hypothetical protein
MAENLEPIPILTGDEVVQTPEETVQTPEETVHTPEEIQTQDDTVYTPEDTPPDIAADDDLVPPERNLPSTDVDL